MQMSGPQHASSCPVLARGASGPLQQLPVAQTRAFRRTKCVRSAMHRAPGHRLWMLADAQVDAAQTVVDIPEKVVQKQLRLKIGATVIPHPDKAHYGGEDAFFISDALGGAFGVADGVGGWAESGINPAEYSRTFMRSACAFLEGRPVTPVTLAEIVRCTTETTPAPAPAPAPTPDPAPAAGPQNGAGRAAAMGMMPVAPPAPDPPPMAPVAAPTPDPLPSPVAIVTAAGEEVSPKGALAAAHAATRLPGSATACVLLLDPETDTLQAANLGDSGFLVVRNGKPLLKSEALQHFFDCPLQFGAFPEHTQATDTAEDAVLYNLKVQAGDVVVAGSDGLWDNCFEADILQLLPTSPDATDLAAKQVAEMAHRQASDPTFLSPYSLEAQKQGFDIPWWEKLMNASVQDGKVSLGQLQGGKMDDVTVVIAVVTEEEGPAATPGASPSQDEAAPVPA